MNVNVKSGDDDSKKEDKKGVDLGSDSDKEPERGLLSEADHKTVVHAWRSNKGIKDADGASYAPVKKGFRLTIKYKDADAPVYDHVFGLERKKSIKVAKDWRKNSLVNAHIEAEKSRQAEIHRRKVAKAWLKNPAVKRRMRYNKRLVHVNKVNSYRSKNKDWERKMHKSVVSGNRSKGQVLRYRKRRIGKLWLNSPSVRVFPLHRYDKVKLSKSFGVERRRRFKFKVGHVRVSKKFVPYQHKRYRNKSW